MRNSIFRNRVFNTLLYVVVQLLFIDRALMSIETFVLLPIYLIPLLMLPINTNKYYVLLFSFFLGLIIDIFSFSGGIFTMITLLIGFLRIYILNFIASKEKLSPEIPSVKMFGLPLFILYFAINFFVFFVAIVLIEFFHFKSFWYNFSTILFNTILNTLVVLGIEFIKNTASRKK